MLDLLNLKYLDSFSLLANEFKIINFPISLTKLNLYRVEGIDFKEFKNLMNLNTLNLCFYSYLPDLEIKSPNLMYVNFDYSKIGKLTPARLKLPFSVLEINMMCCGLESIYELFEFPPQLQVLILYGNELREVPSKLPSMLKVLDLSKNKFEQLKTIPSFPESLESLRIIETGITKNKFGSEYDKLAPMLALFDANIP